MFICIRCGHKELRGPFFCKCGGFGFRVVASEEQIVSLKMRDASVLRKIHQIGRETHGV